VHVPEVLDVIDKFEPEGSVDIDISLNLRNEDKLHVTSRKIVVGLRGNKASLEQLPYPVQELTGRIEWDGQLIRLIGLKGVSNNAPVTIAGLIDPLDHSKDPRRDLFLTANDMEIDDRVIQALPPEVRKVVASLNPEGKADVSAHVKLVGEEQLEVVPKWVNVDLKRMRGRVDAFPYSVKDVTGRVEWRDGRVKLAGIRALAGEGEVSVDGDIDLNEKEENPDDHNVVLTARHVPLDDRLRLALEEPYQELWDSFYPSGNVNVECMLRLGGAEGDPIVRKIVVDLDHCEAEYSGFPYALERMTGKLIIDQDKVIVENVVGYPSDQERTGVIRIDCRIYLDPEGKKADLVSRLHIQAQHVPFDRLLKRSLPQEGDSIWNKLDDAGDVDANLLLAWQHDSPAKITAGSTIAARGICYRTFALPDMSFSVVASEDAIELPDIRGTYYGGNVFGSLKYGRKDGKFDLKLNLYDVDIKQFNAEKGTVGQDVRGSLTASLNLTGTGANTQTFAGKGEININRGQLANIPFFAKLVIELINLAWPGDATITDAKMGCELKDGTIDFSEIILTGTSVPITGAGTIKLDGSVDLLFNTMSKKGLLASIPLVGGLMNDIVNGLRDFIIQVKVTGTIEKPEAHAQPFNPIVSPFKSFVRLIFGSPKNEKEPDKDDTKKK